MMEVKEEFILKSLFILKGFRHDLYMDDPLF